MDKMMVLVVEDDDDIRKLMQAMLQDILGVQTVAASSGEQALQLVVDRPPALILLDLTLPGMGGLEVIRQLRSGVAARRIPIIVCTGCSRGCQEARDAGCDDLIEKPFDVSLFLDKVRQHLPRRVEIACA